jgi:MOSC domain-containing protein YiiM/ferredoxin-NADP reductase
MAVQDVIKTLEQPFSEDIILQVRTGKAKPVFGLTLQSAIYKTARKEPVKISKLGCEGDEHVFHAHGGPEKALMQYCTRHYDTWKKELPQSEHLFTIGGFGENLVAVSANERNVCIGDVMAFGDEVLAQVTYPRAPCAKLNHRFEIKDMSRRSQTLARTGWYYRILREGSIRAGDKMQLIQRPNPGWTVARVQHYLYVEKSNLAAMQEIVALEGLGKEVYNIFSKRLDKNEIEDQEARLTGGSAAFAMKKWADYKIMSRQMETPRIVSLVFAAIEPEDNPLPVQPGSHVRLKLGGKLVRAYSVVGGNSNRFELGIALDAQSRGGSKYLHEVAKPGDVLHVGKPTASFPLSKEADHHIIIAGGIGITALVAAATYLQQSSKSFEIHYAVRSTHDVPFRRYLDCLENVKIYDKTAGQSLNIHAVLARSKANSHVYCCGPQRLMDGVTEAAKVCDIDSENVHFEAFEVASSGQPFTAELALSKQVLKVDFEHSLLEALKSAGFDIDSSCEVGNCGTCRVTVCGGQVEHRGTALVKEEQEKEMLSCVSRGIGKIVLEL